jgi:hypothetical protein
VISQLKRSNSIEFGLMIEVQKTKALTGTNSFNIPMLRIPLLAVIFIFGAFSGISCTFIEGEMRVDREKEMGFTYLLWETVLGPLIQPNGLRYSDYYENDFGSTTSRYLYVENGRLVGVILQGVALAIILATIIKGYATSAYGKDAWDRWKYAFIGVLLGIGVMLGLEIAFQNTIGVLLVIISGAITAVFAMFSVQEASRGPSR